MSRCSVLGLLLCLLAPVTAPAVEAADPPTGALLRYHQGEGDCAVYDSVAVSHEVSTSDDSPTEMDMTCYSLRGRYGFTFRGLSDEGMGRVEVTTGELEAMAEDGGTRMVAAIVMPPEEGEPQAYSLRGELPRDTASGGHSTNDVILLSGVGILPEGAVTVGDTWEGVAQFPQWGDAVHEKSLWRYHSQIVGTDSYDGRGCLKMRTTLSLESIDAGSIERVNGVCATDWLFDPELGLILKADTSGAVAATYTSGRSETITYHSTVKLIEYNGQTLPAD